MGKLKIVGYVISLFALVFLCSFEHDYYVSITNLNIKKDTKQLQIEIKLDAEDLEGVILQEKGKKIVLEKVSDPELNIIKNYITNHFLVWANGGNLKLVLIAKELTADGSFWCYLKAELPDVTQSIKIKNNILLPTFIRQHNIVNLKSNGKVQSHTFIHKQTTHTFKLDAK